MGPIYSDRAQAIAVWQKRRLLIWGVTAAAFITGYFHRTVIGVVSDNLMRDFAIERAADLGLLASIYFWTYAVLQLPAGIMADRFGPRRVVSLSLLISAAGTLIFTLADTLTGLYAGRFVTTLGIGVIYVCLIKLQADWFRLREFATMSGLIVLIGNSGSLLAATPMAFIVDSWGWRNAFHLIAAYSLVMAVACWLLVRDRPEDIGLPGVAELETNLPPPPVPARKPTTSIRHCIRIVCRNKKTWPPVVAGATVYGVYMAISGVWGIPYFMQVYGLSRVDASQMVFIMVIGNMITAPLLGVISDRLQLRRGPFLAATAIFLSALLLLTLWNGAKPPAILLYPLCLLFGVGVSGLSLSVACVKEVNPSYATGIATGITNSGPFLGAAFMQPAVGWILDHYWDGAIVHGVKVYPQIAYTNAFLFCCGVLLISLLAAWSVQETHCRMPQQ